MTTILLDRAPIEPAAGLDSWGDLLQQIESRHLPWSRCVRRVSFDDREIEEFRGPNACQTGLGSLERIEVQSVESREYVGELLAGGPAHLERMMRVLADAVSLYRQNFPRQASERLHSVLLALDSLLALVRTAGAVSGCDFRRLSVGESSLEEEVRAVGAVLEDLVRHQEARDTGAIALTLEQRLAPRLLLWSGLLAELARALTPPQAAPETGSLSGSAGAA